MSYGLNRNPCAYALLVFTCCSMIGKSSAPSPWAHPLLTIHLNFSSLPNYRRRVLSCIRHLENSYIHQKPSSLHRRMPHLKLESPQLTTKLQVFKQSFKLSSSVSYFKAYSNSEQKLKHLLPVSNGKQQNHSIYMQRKSNIVLLLRIEYAILRYYFILRVVGGKRVVINRFILELL